MNAMLPDPSDLAMLLALRPAERLGAIMRLNRTARYANHLDAVALVCRLAERLPGSSTSLPGSSNPKERRLAARLRLR